MFPRHNRILILQLRHWEKDITLAQANKLRECLYKLEEHLREKSLNEAKRRINAKRKERNDVKLGFKLPTARIHDEDLGRDTIGMTDALGNYHIIRQ